jgi:hypothetical protein
MYAHNGEESQDQVYASQPGMHASNNDEGQGRCMDSMYAHNGGESQDVVYATQPGMHVSKSVDDGRGRRISASIHPHFELCVDMPGVAPLPSTHSMSGYSSLHPTQAPYEGVAPMTSTHSTMSGYSSLHPTQASHVPSQQGVTQMGREQSLGRMVHGSFYQDGLP